MCLAQDTSLYLCARLYKTAAATLCIQYTLRYAVLSARAYTIPDRPAMVSHCSPCSPPSIPPWVISKVRFNTDLINFLLLPPGSTTCFAHCALRSKLHYHLPRLAAAWGSGITGSGLSSPFPLLRSTQSRSDRAENFEANTHPYRIPTLLPYTSTQPLIQLTPVSIDTTIRL